MSTDEQNPFSDFPDPPPFEDNPSATPLIYQAHAKETNNIDTNSSTWYTAPLIMYILLFLAAFMGGLVFVFTCMQLKDDQKAGSVKLDSCDSVPHLPLRFEVNFNNSFISCAWSVKESVSRFFLSFFTLFFPLSLVVCIYQKKKLLAYIWIILAAVSTVGYFAVMVSDADSIRKSVEWCKGGWNVSPTPPHLIPSTDISCDYQPFIATTGFDALAFVIWLITTIWIAKIIWDRSIQLFSENTYSE